jgi:hypothetical protein
MPLTKAVLVTFSAAGVCALVAAASFHVTAPYFDGKAQVEAQAFCDSVAIGESVTSVKTRAHTASIKLEEWSPRGSEVRYVAWFSGFLANAATCEIALNEGHVASKFVEKHTW